MCVLCTCRLLSCYAKLQETKKGDNNRNMFWNKNLIYSVLKTCRLFTNVVLQIWLLMHVIHATLLAVHSRRYEPWLHSHCLYIIVKIFIHVIWLCVLHILPFHRIGSMGIFYSIFSIFVHLCLIKPLCIMYCAFARKLQIRRYANHMQKESFVVTVGVTITNCHMDVIYTV